jgi:hypothetical protein
MSYLVGLQGAMILRIAAVHHLACTPPSGCDTCPEIADAIALLLAIQRLDELDRFRSITRRLRGTTW